MLSIATFENETLESYRGRIFDKHCDGKGFCNSGTAYSFMNECFKDQYKAVYGKECNTDLSMEMFAREWARIDLTTHQLMSKQAML
jgi:hypothetical protein